MHHTEYTFSHSHCIQYDCLISPASAASVSLQGKKSLFNVFSSWRSLILAKITFNVALEPCFRFYKFSWQANNICLYQICLIRPCHNKGGGFLDWILHLNLTLRDCLTARGPMWTFVDRELKPLSIWAVFRAVLSFLCVCETKQCPSTCPASWCQVIVPLCGTKCHSGAEVSRWHNLRGTKAGSFHTGQCIVWLCWWW